MSGERYEYGRRDGLRFRDSARHRLGRSYSVSAYLGGRWTFIGTVAGGDGNIGWYTQTSVGSLDHSIRHRSRRLAGLALLLAAVSS